MMTSERGWYPDPSDEHTMRFWTGTQWVGTRTWDGTAWVDQVAPATDSHAAAPSERVIASPAPAKPAIASPAPAGKVAAATRPSISSTGYLLFGGAAVAALASFLPWVQATGLYGNTVSASPQGGGPVFLMCLAAAVVWVGWPARLGGISTARRIGLSALSALLWIFVFSNFGDLSTLQRQNPTAHISGGPGLYLYTAGVVALSISVVRTWLAGHRPSAAGDAQQ